MFVRVSVYVCVGGLADGGWAVIREMSAKEREKLVQNLLLRGKDSSLWLKFLKKWKYICPPFSRPLHTVLCCVEKK